MLNLETPWLVKLTHKISHRKEEQGVEAGEDGEVIWKQIELGVPLGCTEQAVGIKSVTCLKGQVSKRRTRSLRHRVMADTTEWK